MSLVMKRRSVRQYTNDPVSDEDIKKLLTSAMQAPSAKNLQPWEFIIVRDRDTLNELSKVSKGAWMLAQAPLCITVVMKDMGDSGIMAPQDLGACVQNILLEAVNLGLGACWIGAFPIEERTSKITEILDIRNGTPFANVAIGHPTEVKEVTPRYDASRVQYHKVK